jgi:hypothetical protein
MVGTIRVLVGVSVIAQLVAVVALLQARRAFEVSVYGDRNASLFMMVALALLWLVGMTAVIVAAIHLWEVGGGWRWAWWAGGLLCVVAQGHALVGSHRVEYLVAAGLHVVAGLALAVSLGPRRSAVVPAGVR